MVRGLCIWLALAASCWGQDAGEVIWPIEERKPLPAIEPAPADVSVLYDDEVFVVVSKGPAKLPALVSPADAMTVTAEQGPLKIRGRFAGGNGGMETRTFGDGWVYTFEARRATVCEIILVQDPDNLQRRTLDVGKSRGAPRPPTPKPVEPVEPPEPVKPPEPKQVTGPIQLLIIHEAADQAKLPPGQLYAMQSLAVREYCKSHCRKGDGGTPDFRTLDDDLPADILKKYPEWVQKAWEVDRPALPCFLVSNGTTGTAGTIPDSEEKFLEILKRYGGE